MIIVKILNNLFEMCELNGLKNFGRILCDMGWRLSWSVSYERMDPPRKLVYSVDGDMIQK